MPADKQYHSLTEKLFDPNSKALINGYPHEADTIIRQYLSERAKKIDEHPIGNNASIMEILGLDEVGECEHPGTCASWEEPCGPHGVKRCPTCNKHKPLPTSGEKKWCEHITFSRFGHVCKWPDKDEPLPQLLPKSAMFCPLCGTPRPTEPKKCSECGQEIKNA